MQEEENGGRKNKDSCTSEHVPLDESTGCRSVSSFFLHLKGDLNIHTKKGNNPLVRVQNDSEKHIRQKTNLTYN